MALRLNTYKTDLFCKIIYFKKHKNLNYLYWKDNFKNKIKPADYSCGNIR